MKKKIIMKSWSIPVICYTLLFFGRTTLIYSWVSETPVGKAAGMTGRLLPFCSWQCSPFSKLLQKQKSVHGGGVNALHYLELKYEFEVSGLACS